MKPVFIILFALAGIVVSGCGGPEPESEPARPAASTPVFDPMVEALDQAKAVQDLDQKHKQQIDEQLDQD